MDHISGSREGVRFVHANLRRLVERGYPTDRHEKAARTVLEQAELLSDGPLATRRSRPIMRRMESSAVR